MVPFSIMGIMLKSRAWAGVEYIRHACPVSTLVGVKSLVWPEFLGELEAMAVIAD